jgi:DNA-binding Lrp family transcriptional regulator
MEDVMPTIAEAVKQLGLTRDQLHYLIKKKFVEPQKEGKRFVLSDEDIEKVRRLWQERIKPVAALILLQIAGTRTEEAVYDLKDRCPEIVWVAGAWGESSVIALLEAPKFDTIALAPFDLRNLDYITDTRTYIIPPEHYHVKETTRETPAENERLAVILVNLVNNSNRNLTRGVEDLGDIQEVRRYGAIFGPWDAFAEVRYEDADALQSIVLDRVYKTGNVLRTNSILTMRRLRRERVLIPQVSS